MSQKFKKLTSLDNLWFQVIKNNGTSFYRSWTNKKGDQLSKIRMDIGAMLDNPKITSSISTGKFDLTFKAMMPIYDGNDFIGIFEVIAKFNSIADKLANEAIDSVFLVDKNYKNQLTKAYTKIFLDDYYVINRDVKEEYLKIIQTHHVENYILPENEFFLDKENSLLVVYFGLTDIKNNPMGHFILFKSLNEIAVDDIYSTRNQLLLVITFLLFFYLSSFDTFRIGILLKRLKKLITTLKKK